MNLATAREYFYDLHDNVCNQKYADTLPYSFHLECVAKQAEIFKSLIPENEYYSVMIAIYGHDSIEDARLTYNDIKAKFGHDVAEIIFLCTEDKGRNRLARKSDKWYDDLVTNRAAVFVKLCDLIANIKFSHLMNSKMLIKYDSEWEHSRSWFSSIEPFNGMVLYIDKLLAI